MRRTTGLAIAAVAVGLAGCAQNAYFELQVDLPPNPPGETWFAHVQVRNDQGHDFGIPWMGGDVSTVPLTNARQWDCISVQGFDASISLNVRVRFCRAEDCLALEDGDPPERLFSFETPFYIGSRTYYRVSIPSVPVCATDEDCDVGLCMSDRCGCNSEADCGTGYRCAVGSGCIRVVDRCSIEGCIEGPVSATFCSTETGQHFCERNPDITRDDTFMCPIAE